MKNIYIKITFIFYMLTSLSNLVGIVPYQAVTIVPVADLLGDSAQNTTLSKKNISTCYNQLPLCSQKPPQCSRLHQVLFNEIITVIEEKDEEVRIMIPNLFFQVEGTLKKHTTYWALKKNFASLDHLKKHNIQRSKIPQPIQYESANIPTLHKAPTITLIEPFFDAQSNRTFSSGTRFIAKTFNSTTITVFALTENATKIITMNIPKKITVTESQKHNHEEQIRTLIKILKLWAHPKQGFIPYVWGGCSYTKECLEEKYSKTITNNYHREKYCNNQTKTGFDCTGLLARAAQIAGLPYYFKNSTTILKNLRELTENEQPQNGDIIWLPGHIMIISDIKNNLIIEARSYDHGWGKIHEAPIHAIFENVPTLNILLNLCCNKKKLKRIHRNGDVVQEIISCKILSLRSIWQ